MDHSTKNRTPFENDYRYLIKWTSDGSGFCFFDNSRNLPILEYACPVWHSMLTKKQASAIESQQIRAMRIIFGDIKYEEALELAGISTLQDRRENLTRKFFLSICHPDSCLYYLLPAPRDNEIVLRLRNSNNYPVPLCKTRRLQMSFLPYSLNKFQ